MVFPLARPRQRSLTHRSTLAAASLAILGAAGVLGATWIIQYEPNSNTTEFGSAYDKPHVSEIGAAAMSAAAGIQPGLLKNEETAARTFQPAQNLNIRLAGTLVDASGQTIRGSSIYAIPLFSDIAKSVLSPVGVSAGALLTSAANAPTDDKGGFVIETTGVDSDEFLIYSISKDAGPAFARVIATNRDIRLTASKNHKISGSILDGGRRPVPHAAISIIHPRMSVDAPQGLDAAVAFAALRQTRESDDQGRFEVGGLDEGPFTIIVSAPNCATAKRIDTNLQDSPITIILAPQAQFSGRVTDNSERPIAGAVIATARILQGAQSSEEGDDTITDARGIFTLNAAPAGGCAFQVRVSANGFATKQVLMDPLAERENKIQNFVLETACDIQVKVTNSKDEPIPGALVEAYDASSRLFMVAGKSNENGMVTLPGVAQDQHYRIFALADAYALGWITDATPRTHNVIQLDRAVSLRGIVTNEDGAPIEGARISFRQEGDRDEDSTVRDSATSASNGEFEAGNLQRGTYTIIADAPGFAPKRLSPVIVESTAGRLEFKLRRGQAWHGRVVDRTGNGLPDVQISIAENGSSSGRTRGVIGAAVHTDSDGLFILKCVPEDTNHLLLARGNAPPRVVAVQAQNNITETRELGEISWIAGGEIKGTVIGTTGSPIAGMSVLLLTSEVAGEAAPRVATDAQGQFAFHDIPPGHHGIDFIDTNVSALNGSFRRISRDVYVAEASSTSILLNLHDTIRVGGRVRVLGAIPGNEVEVVARKVNCLVPERGACTPNWDGTYELLIPEPGTFSLELRSVRGPAIRTSRIVTLNAGDSKTVDLEIGDCTISGWIRSGTTDEPVPNARITLADGQGVRWFATSDSKGCYRIEGLPQGRISLFAQAPGYASSQITTVELSSARPRTADLMLFEGATLIVSTAGKSEQGVGGATVTLWNTDNEAIASARTDGFGEAVFEDLKAGDYSIAVEHADYEGFCRRVSIRGKARNTASIILKKAGGLSIQVHDQRGTPAALLGIWITTSTGMTRLATCDHNGIAQFTTVAEGPVVIEIGSENFLTTNVEAGKLSHVETSTQ
ncbi:MAG: carboxypeptidase regulatory-like domain-containing protein [Planctomycetes bacterium]|nr:carboxypeptidase regulatory-like domain-containing protein [Planctomycetota bacterium]